MTEEEIRTDEIEFKGVKFHVLDPHREKYDIRGTIVAEHGEQRIESGDKKLTPRNFQSFADLCSDAFSKILDDDVENLKTELLGLTSKAREVVEETGGAVPQDMADELLEEFEEEEISDEKLAEAEEVIEKGNVLPKVLELVDNAWVGDYERKLIYWISALSRPLIGESINCCSVGSPGKGKSVLQKLMLNLIPNENSFYRTEISAKHLQYLTREIGSDCFENTVVLYDDARLSKEKVNTLETISDPEKDELREGTVEDQDTVTLHLSPPPTIWTNLTEHFWKDTLRSRFFEESPDESAEMDKEVSEYQQEEIRMGINRKENVDYELGKALFRKILEKFENYHPIIPYKWEWNADYDRRLQPVFGRILKVVTVLNSELRLVLPYEKEDKRFVFSAIDDFYIAKMLMDKFIEEKQGLTNTKVRILDALDVGKENAKETSEIADITGLNSSTIINNIKGEAYPNNLSRTGFVDYEEPKKEGRGYSYEFWKTGEKKVFNTFLSLSRFYIDSNSLREDFEEVIGKFLQEKYAMKKGDSSAINKYWSKYWKKLTNPSFLTFPTLQNFTEKSLETSKSVIQAEKTFEPINTLLETLKEELKPKKEILKDKLYRLYAEEGGTALTKEQFISLANKRFKDNKKEIKEAVETIGFDFSEDTSANKISKKITQGVHLLREDNRGLRLRNGGYRVR